MRKLFILAFIILTLGFILSVTALLVPGTGDAMGGFFGGLFGGATGIITGTTVGLMQWGSISFINASVVIVGLIFSTAIFWILLTRTFWPRVRTVFKGTPAQVPIIHQTQPSVQIPTHNMQSQPASIKQKESDEI